MQGSLERALRRAEYLEASAAEYHAAQEQRTADDQPDDKGGNEDDWEDEQWEDTLEVCSRPASPPPSAESSPGSSPATSNAPSRSSSPATPYDRRPSAKGSQSYCEESPVGTQFDTTDFPTAGSGAFTGRRSRRRTGGRRGQFYTPEQLKESGCRVIKWKGRYVWHFILPLKHGGS
jgi:hypothetical protein